MKTYREEFEELKENYFIDINNMVYELELQKFDLARESLKLSTDKYKELEKLKQKIEENGCSKEIMETHDFDRAWYTYCGKNFEEMYCNDCEQLIKEIEEILK